MAKLGDLARLIRSKNAGPFTLTFDVMFDDDATYRRVLKSKVLTKEKFARIYQVPEEEVLFFEHDAAQGDQDLDPPPYCAGLARRRRRLRRTAACAAGRTRAAGITPAAALFSSSSPAGSAPPSSAGKRG